MPPGHGVHRHLGLSLLLFLWQGGRGVVVDGLMEGLQRRVQAPVASARNQRAPPLCPGGEEGEELRGLHGSAAREGIHGFLPPKLLQQEQASLCLCCRHPRSHVRSPFAWGCLGCNCQGHCMVALL